MMEYLITGLAIGILGNAHCIGMCGPLALAIPLPENGRKAWAIVLYQMGKTMAYMALGLLLSFIGTGFNFFKCQQIFSITLGILMLIFVFRHYLLKKHNTLKMPYAHLIQKQLSLWFDKPKNLKKYPILGFLNGLLPCGLVYLAIGAAGLSGSMQGAIWVTFGFGLGTSPMLVLMMVFKKRFATHWRFQRVVPILVSITSLLIIIRGLNIGIPYLSPKQGVANNTIENCCSKNE